MLHYKGEPDPLKGDVPNQKVRDSAREALDALYGAETGYAPSATAAPQLTVGVPSREDAKWPLCQCLQHAVCFVLRPSEMTAQAHI